MRPNILFLVIDSLRADKLYGFQKTSKTPNMDRLIKKGVYFSNNISAADGTVLSWASMFTGLEPFKTGVRSERYNKIDSTIETYFSKLKKVGYFPYGCVPKFANAFGMIRDFTNEDRTYDHFQSLPEGLGNTIISKLKSQTMSEPWIYFVHINDIHFPIIPPQNYDRDEFGVSKYERTISSIDEWIGKILDAVDLQKTLVVITADHGSYVPSVQVGNKWINFETDGTRQKLTTKLGNKIPSFLEPVKTKAFFMIENYRKKSKEDRVRNISLTPYQQRSLFSQRGDLDHFLFDERIRVPLLFVGCGIKASRTVKTQVRSIDIFPTIAEIVGLDINDNVDGRSLLPLLEGKPFDELPAFIVSSPLIEVKSNDVIGIRTSEYKYFRDVSDPTKRIHLFDLRSDPLEEHNISEKNPDLVSKFESILQKKQSEIKLANPEYTEDELKNIEKELKKMGYI